MSLTETFATPDDVPGGYLRSSEIETPLGESLAAQGGEAFMGGARALFRGLVERPSAEGFMPDMGGGVMPPEIADQFDPAKVPTMPMADAKARVKQEGLEPYLKLPEQDTIKAPVLDLMLRDARERAQYAAAVDRGPKGFLPGALGFATQIGTGMIDPVNLAAFSIPVMGEARYGQLLASAGESILGRAAIRAGVGAAQGGVGGAALTPLDWWLHTQDGQDYTFADALKSVVLSAGMGGLFHAGGGLAGDLFARARGRPLAGAAPVAGAVLPEEALTGEGIDLGEVPGITTKPAQNIPENIPAPHPAEVLADLPPSAQEDVVRSAAASLIKGEPVRSAEMLQEAAKADPRIAESTDPYFEAYHGSPHDFDQFDINKIGAGEGAQAYGHGLYFAENEAVAREYRTRLAREEEGIAKEAWDDPELGPRLREASRDYHAAEDNLAVASNEGDSAVIGEVMKRVGDAVRAWDAVRADAAEKFPGGAVYKVRVAADREHFLDWDKPLSEQSPRVQSGVAKAMGGDPNFMAYPGQWLVEKTGLRAAKDRLTNRTLSGSDAYHALSAKQAVRQASGIPGRTKYTDSGAASETLRRAGIPGIKYLDQGSRYLGDVEELQARLSQLQSALGNMPKSDPLHRHAEAAVEDYRQRLANAQRGETRNYVVFDDKLIRITHKNGKEVGLDTAKAAALQHPDVRDAVEKGMERPIVETPMPSGANSIKGGPVVVDPRVPQELRRPAAVHETVEEELEALGFPYLHAHEIATQAEKRVVESMGMNWEEYTHRWDGILDATEHEKVSELPQDLHVDPEAAIGHHRAENKQTEPAPRAAQQVEQGRGTAPEQAPNVVRPDWQSLAQRPADDPSITEASKAAERAPEPPDTPEKSVTLAEQKLAEAEKTLNDILPTLSEDERKAVEDSLKATADDKKVRDQIVRETMACLLGATEAA